MYPTVVDFRYVRYGPMKRLFKTYGPDVNRKYYCIQITGKWVFLHKFEYHSRNLQQTNVSL